MNYIFDADKCSKIKFLMLTSVLKVHLGADECSKIAFFFANKCSKFTFLC